METLPTVLVPGLALGPGLYGHQIPALWALGPVTIANHTGQSTMSALAADILAHAPPRFALAGLSMGGYTAFEIMRQAPERVLKLMLLDTSARSDPPEQTERRKEAIAKAEAGDMQQLAASMIPSWLHAKQRDDRDLIAFVEAMFLATGPEGFVRQQKSIASRPDSRPGLREINCPTLVLVGDGDELTTPAFAREIAEGIAGARLVTVPDAGHLSPLEQPEFVTQALVVWLQEG